MNDNNMKGQVAVVTGGAQGLGFAAAQRLTAAGVKVAIWDVNERRDQAAAELGGEAIAVQMDVTDPASAQAAVEETERRLGPVSILVNSAGIAGKVATVEDYTVEEWHRVIDLNLNGTFHVNRVVISSMKEKNYGRIVNIASIAGKEGNPNAGAYSASKAGVIGLTKTLGKELASYDIAVNCITPAAARTPIFDQISQEHIDFMLSKIPRARFLEVAEAAEMIFWLVSPQNSFTTAAVFDLSGGRATY
jgi:NAD(P)-dependent dehydrogenase (short-subunit alcohol dehydrogenase family)